MYSPTNRCVIVFTIPKSPTYLAHKIELIMVLKCPSKSSKLKVIMDVSKKETLIY